MHIILSLKLGDHEGLPLLVHGQLLKRTLFIVLPANLTQILIGAFLSPVPVSAESGLGLCGAAWQLLVGHQHPRTQLWKTQYRFCIFHIISVIINISNVISAISKAVFMFNL